LSISVKIDDQTEIRLRKLATSRQTSTDGLMREAIEQFVEREENRESFKLEAERSWQDFQQSGQHLSGEEVRTWMETWGTEAETEPPQCHD
jgi:predicted transcriptional regulator